MVLIELNSADNPKDSIVLLYRGRKEFQDKESTSFGSCIAIGRDIEWFALPCRREEPAFTQTDKVLYDGRVEDLNAGVVGPTHVGTANDVHSSS